MDSDGTKNVTRVEKMSDAVPGAVEKQPQQPQQPRRDVKGAIWTLFVGVALPCTPVIIITAVLLAFIFNYRVNGWPGYQELTPPTPAAKKNPWDWMLDFKKTGGPAFFVDRSATTITTIAGWTSKVLPYLTSSIMALIAFFAAKRIVLNSRKGHEATLLTPEQLTLLIGMLGGSSFSPLIDTLMFWKHSKQRLPAPLPAVFWSLLTITSLGLILPLVDTWFSVTTIAVPLVIFSNTTVSQAYGRQLDTVGTTGPCLNGPSNPLPNSTQFWPCDVDVQFGFTNDSTHLTLEDPIGALKMEYNISTTTLLRSVTHGSNQYFFYVDTAMIDQLDFRASSPAMSTQCIPMTQQCLNDTHNGTFACSAGFSGDVSNRIFPYTLYPPTSNNSVGYPQDSKSLGIGFSTTADLSTLPPLTNLQDSIRIDVSYPSFLVQNPQYFGVWAINYPDTVSVQSSSLSNDPEISFVGDNFDTIWFLNCSTVIANATYTFVNGSLQAFDPAIMDDYEMAALFTAPFNLFLNNQIIGTSMANMATLASLATSANELATIWAAEFSKTALSLAHGVFVPLKNSLQQDRATKIVAQVPKIPLFLLIGLKLLYVLAVILLAVGAYAFTQPAETELVLKKLSTKGLAAAYFNSPELLQQNAVDAVQDLVAPKKEGVTAEVREVQVGDAPKVGLLPDAQGVWNFAVQADGVWHSIKPIVDIMVDAELENIGFKGA